MNRDENPKSQTPAASDNPFTIRLHFHRDLDFFLGRSARGVSVIRRLFERTSVKDVIESCGVPHTEVDLILINDRAVDFDFVLRNDTTADVYSVNSAIGDNSCRRLQDRRIDRFVADGHLGKLARNLRLLGFDVAYDRCAEDGQLLDVMTREERA